MKQVFMGKAGCTTACKLCFLRRHWPFTIVASSLKAQPGATQALLVQKSVFYFVGGGGSWELSANLLRLTIKEHNKYDLVH